MEKENQIINNLKSLEVSEGWQIIKKALKEDKEALIQQLIYNIKATDDKWTYSKSDLWREKIALIDTMIDLPGLLKEQYEPVIKTDTPS